MQQINTSELKQMCRNANESFKHINTLESIHNYFTAISLIILCTTNLQYFFNIDINISFCTGV